MDEFNVTLALSTQIDIKKLYQNREALLTQEEISIQHGRLTWLLNMGQQLEAWHSDIQLCIAPGDGNNNDIYKRPLCAYVNQICKT